MHGMWRRSGSTALNKMCECIRVGGVRVEPTDAVTDYAALAVLRS